MAVIGKVLSAPLKALGLVSTPGKLPNALPAPSTDDAAQQQQADDDIRKRRGGAADIITGASGAGTPLTGGKLTLGS